MMTVAARSTASSSSKSRPEPDLRRSLKSNALLLALAACGDNRQPAREDAPSRLDASGVADAMIDAFVLPSCANPVAGTTVRTRKLLDTPGESPVLVTAPRNDPRRFVVMREGVIRIVGDDDQLKPTAFFDMNNALLSGGEQGLLGVAFHPQYATNRRFFIYFTRAEPGDTTFNSRDVVARCEASATDPDVAMFTNCVEILAIRDRKSGHNAGALEFGPDGYLYISTGDGGAPGDPDRNGQALSDKQFTQLTIAMQGKILRIDVDHQDAGKQYAVPADNPFLSSGAPEVFALGLRNPWRFSFDANGDVYIGDVGQDTIEEINYAPAGQLRGANFGWSMFEGVNCFKAPCDATGKTFPVDSRVHTLPDVFTAVIGGQVYRGTCFPDLNGIYFYADYRGGQLSQATIVDGVFTRSDLVAPTGEKFPNNVSSIHADARGELYITTIEAGVNTSSSVFHIEVKP
jgi:glucose/arabinose dehydrogenase